MIEIWYDTLIFLFALLPIQASSCRFSSCRCSFVNERVGTRQGRFPSKSLSKMTRWASERLGSEQERTVVILYHKPRNVITSHSNADAVAISVPIGRSGSTSTEPTGRTTVYDDIESMNGHVGSNSSDDFFCFEEATGIRSKWHAIGRLDADTTGMLLLTNDGGLVHHATNPTSKSHGELGVITKTYEALIMGHHEEESSPALEQIRTTGVNIGAKYGGWTKPVPSQALRVLEHPTAKSTLVSITIAEGKNRQVRRMFHGVQSGVMQLHRSRIGKTLTLGNLEEGQWRVLSEEEVLDSLHWNCRTLATIGQRDGRAKSEKSKPTRSSPRRRRQRRR